MFEHSCKDYHSMHNERIKLRLERICQVKLPCSLQDNDKPLKFPTTNMKEYDQLFLVEARELMMNDKYSFPCQNPIESVQELKSYEEAICTDLLEEEEAKEVESILITDRLPIKRTSEEEYKDYLDYYDLSESKEQILDCHLLVSEEICQPFYNASIVFSSLLEKAKFNSKPEIKAVDNLLSDDTLLSEWMLLDSLPREYSLVDELDYTTKRQMAFTKEDSLEEIKEIPICYDQTEPLDEFTSSITLGEEILNESNISHKYHIEENNRFLEFSKEMSNKYLSAEMSQTETKFNNNNSTDLFELDTLEDDCRNTIPEIEHKYNMNIMDEFSILFQESSRDFIYDIASNEKPLNEYWCLAHLESEIQEERSAIFSSDSIINSDDIRTIPCPLLDAKPVPIKLIPIEDIAKPKLTSNIEISLQNLWLSDSIYVSRKEAEWSDGKSLASDANLLEYCTKESFDRELLDDSTELEIILKIPTNMTPNSKSRVLSERIFKKLNEIEELEREFNTEDMFFLQDLFQQTSIYSETVSHYQDDGKGALYKYESLMETLVDIGEFENYNLPATNMEEEDETNIIIEQDSPNLSPIEVKEKIIFNEFLEDNLDAFLTFKKPSLAPIPSIEQKEKDVMKEETLFIPEDIQISSRHSQMVNSLLVQNSLVVLQDDELRMVEGVLLLQKLKNCSSNSMFIHIDSDETRLEKDFRFTKSFLCNHTKSLAMVTRDNFTTKISSISKNCKILFIARSIAESFIQRMETFLSKCCLIIYKEHILIEQDQFVSILKFIEGMYTISKKNIQTIIMSCIPSRDIQQLSHLLDSTMSKQLLLDAPQPVMQKIRAPVSGKISKFLENIVKVGEFTLSSISGVKGYNFESLKFLNIQSDFLKRIVEEYASNLKVVLSSNDSKRIIETRTTFKKLVCLHTLKYLFEATLDGGISVGRAYLEKIKETDTYRTLLDGAISEISFQMVKLSNEVEDKTKLDTIVANAKEFYFGKTSSKLIILSKHNKVLSDIAKALEEELHIFTLFNFENTLKLKSLHVGTEMKLSEGVVRPESHIYLTTFSNIAHISDVNAFNGIDSLLQIEPGDFNDVLYSMVCRNKVNYTTISSRLEKEDMQTSIDILNQSWVRNLKNVMKIEKELLVNSKIVDQLLQKQRNFSILKDEELETLETMYCLKPKSENSGSSRIIVTEKCIQNNDLISELESRFSINVVERNSTLFSPADIIVNERHCIILYNFNNIDTYREETTDLFNRILSLALQFSYCWVIIESNSANLSIDSLSFVSSSLLCFTKSLQIEVNLRYSYNMDQSAEIINSICMEVMAQSKALNHDIIWIREKENAQEAFLSKFPCVNFFSAQAIVQNYSIKEICQMKSYEEFSQHLGRYFTETGLKLIYNVLFEIFDGFEESNHIVVEAEDEHYRADNVMDISQDNPSTFNNSFITQQDQTHSFINEPTPFSFDKPAQDYSFNQKRLFSATQQDNFISQESIFQPFKKSKIMEMANLQENDRGIPPPSPLFGQRSRVIQEQPPSREAFTPIRQAFRAESMSPFSFNNVEPAFTPFFNTSNYQQQVHQPVGAFMTPSRNVPIQHYQDHQPYFQPGMPSMKHANANNNISNTSIKSMSNEFNTPRIQSNIGPKKVPNIPVKLQVPPSDNIPRTKIDFEAFKYKPRNGKLTKKW